MELSQTWFTIISTFTLLYSIQLMVVAYMLCYSQIQFKRDLYIELIPLLPYIMDIIILLIFIKNLFKNKES